MSQINHGIRSILSLPLMYRLFSNLLGTTYGRETLINNYIRPQNGDTILDIGCGTGWIVPYLPPVNYYGFDASHSYIETAQKLYGDRATFVCETVSNQTLKQPNEFDIVLAIGVLHHLNDHEYLQLCQLAHAALKPGGRLVTYDGCYVKGQSPIARYLLSQDRGKNVRDQQGYFTLISQVFSDVKVTIRNDFLRIPYTHIIMECSK